MLLRVVNVSPCSAPRTAVRPSSASRYRMSAACSPLIALAVLASCDGALLLESAEDGDIAGGGWMLSAAANWSPLPSCFKSSEENQLIGT